MSTKTTSQGVPALVRWACYIWLLFGLAQGWSTLRALTAGMEGVAVLPGVFAVGFMGVALYTLFGKAKETLRNGVGSLGIGILLILFVATFLAREMGPVELAVGFGPASLLVLAGVLAIAGNRSYVASRVTPK